MDSGLGCDDGWVEVEGADFGCWNSCNWHGLGGAMAPAVATAPRPFSVSAAGDEADAEIEGAGAAVDLGKQCSPLGMPLHLLGPEVDNEEGVHL